MSKVKNEIDASIKMCLVPREVAVKHLNDLIAKNQDVFDMYFLWANVLNSPVDLVSEEKHSTKDTSKN